jgi:hypothetical protein
LTWLAKTWTDQWPEDVPLPYVYPTPLGGIQLEWSMPAASISVDVDVTKRVAELLMSRTADGEVLEELALDLSAPDGWPSLAEAVRRASNAQ